MQTIYARVWSTGVWKTWEDLLNANARQALYIAGQFALQQ